MTNEDRLILMMIILRAQKPLIVEIRGMFPAFSLQQFGIVRQNIIY